MLSMRKLVVTAMVTGVVSGAAAHHSNAVFERNKDVTLSGTVTKFEWTNPHVWIWFMATLPDGSQQEWALESAAPVQLRKAGFTWQSFKAGDKVSFVLHPLRSGQPGGQFVKATFADGRVIETPDPAAKAKE